jgi:hypothetical protein
MKERLIAILLSPFFLAAIISVIIIILLPPVINKYELVLLDRGIVEKNGGVCYFEDLDSDGISEETIASPTINGNASFRIQSLDKALWDQWNFRGQYQLNPKIIFSDYDNNGKKEIFLTTLIADSIFLHMVTPETGEKDKKEIFIDKLDTSKGKNDFSFGPIKAADFNNDNYNDILIFIFAGFTQQPRKLYVYDIKNDTIYKTPLAGTMIRGEAEIADLNNDGYTEIYGGTPAPNNNNNLKINLHDSAAWFVYLNHQLDFIFNPIPFYGRKPSLDILNFKKDEKACFLCLYKNRGKNSKKLELLLINNNGKKIIEKELKIIPEFTQSIRLIKHFDGKNTSIYFQNGTIIYKVLVTDEIKLIKKSELNLKAFNSLNQYDINRDGIMEFVLTSNKFHELTILDKNLKHPAKITIPDPNRKVVKFENILDKDNNKFFLQVGNKWFIYHYKKNILYNLKPLLHILVFLITLTLVLLTRKLQKIQIEKSTKNREGKLLSFS